MNGESDAESEILSLIKKSEMPESFDYGEANNYVVYEEMLLCHFEIYLNTMNHMNNL